MAAMRHLTTFSTKPLQTAWTLKEANVLAPLIFRNKFVSVQVEAFKLRNILN